MRKKMMAVAALASLAAVSVSTGASARGGFGFHGGAAGFHGGFHGGGGWHGGGWHGGWGHRGVWPGAAVVGVVGSYYDPYAYQGYDAGYYGGYGGCYPNTIWAPPYGWIVQSSCGGW